MLALAGGGAFWRLRSDASDIPPTKLTTAAEILASMENPPGLSVDVTVVPHEDEQHLNVVVTNDGDEPLVFEQRFFRGQIRVYVDEDEAGCVTARAGEGPFVGPSLPSTRSWSTRRIA